MYSQVAFIDIFRHIFPYLLKCLFVDIHFEYVVLFTDQLLETVRRVMMFEIYFDQISQIEHIEFGFYFDNFLQNFSQKLLVETAADII